MSTLVDRDYGEIESSRGNTTTADYIRPLVLTPEEIEEDEIVKQALSCQKGKDDFTVRVGTGKHKRVFEFESDYYLYYTNRERELSIIGATQRKYKNIPQEKMEPKENHIVKTPKVWSVESIIFESELTIEDLSSHRILIGRKQASKFISSYRVIRESMFEKFFTVDSFIYKFGFRPYTIDGDQRSMLLTYAQWWHFVGLPGSPSIPPKLREWTPTGFLAAP